MHGFQWVSPVDAWHRESLLTKMDSNIIFANNTKQKPWKKLDYQFLHNNIKLHILIVELNKSWFKNFESESENNILMEITHSQILLSMQYAVLSLKIHTSIPFQ